LGRGGAESLEKGLEIPRNGIKVHRRWGEASIPKRDSRWKKRGDDIEEQGKPRTLEASGAKKGESSGSRRIPADVREEPS